jgi:hypothetical protein
MTGCFLVGPQESARLRTIDAIKLLVRHGMMVSSEKLVIESLIDAHFGAAGMIWLDGMNVPGCRYRKLHADVPVMIAVSVPGVPDRRIFRATWRRLGSLCSTTRSR